MCNLYSSLLWAACLLGGGPPAEPAGSYLLTWIPCADGSERTLVEEYVPQPGDMVLYDQGSKRWRFLYHFVGSCPPDHSGLVVPLPDGRLALLESGPDDGKMVGLWVAMLEVMPRLHGFHGIIYIRRLQHPLSPEQSARLCAWAQAQNGKRYALGRLLLQATPIRCRSGWRAQIFGKTYLDRRAYLCSELVVAGETVAGLMDPHVHKANMIYPRDLLYDDHYDLSHTWCPAAVWSPTPNWPEVPEGVEPSPLLPARTGCLHPAPGTAGPPASAPGVVGR
jgi:hypothetical protein